MRGTISGGRAAPLGELGDMILIRTDLMRSVAIDPDTKIARVEAGAVWNDILPVLTQHGLAALAGSAGDVGIVGYTLGGGIGWLARSHGLAANSVTAVELVTADGRWRRVDEHHDADLFWALRGGGGSFGVVTALEFRLYPVAALHAGALFWPIERSREILQAWREWTRGLPASVTSVGRILRFPPLPDLPPHLSGRAFVVIEAACQDPDFVADVLFAELRALGPEMDTIRRLTPAELIELHMDPPGPVPSIGQGALVRSLTAETVDAFVAATLSPTGAPLLSAELRHLGGALHPARGEGGVVAGLDGEAIMFAVGMLPDPTMAPALEAAIGLVCASLEPWRAERDYLNFAEAPTPGSALFGDAWERLRQIKSQVDPTDLIRGNHPVLRAEDAK